MVCLLFYKDFKGWKRAALEGAARWRMQNFRQI